MGYRDDPYWEDDEYSSDFGEGNIRTWSYSKGGNTKDAPASGGWIKSKFGDYYIRKNLF